MKKWLVVLSILAASLLVAFTTSYLVFNYLKEPEVAIDTSQTDIPEEEEEVIVEKEKEEVNLEELLLKSPNLDKIENFDLMAVVEIPKIRLTQLLVEGVEYEAIDYFLGHFPDTAMAGQDGNFAITGHRITDYTDGLINLYKLVKGDEINIITASKKYVYEVAEKYIVEPTEVDVLDPTEDATITVITCTVGAKQRVVVKGKLISEEDI